MSTEPSAMATSAQSVDWDALLFRHPRRDSSTSATISLWSICCGWARWVH